MARVLVVFLSVLAVLLRVSAVPTDQDCASDQESCVLLLQTALDVRNARPTADIPEGTWMMPTGERTAHTGTVVGSTAENIDGDPLRCLEASCAYGILLTEELRRGGRKLGHGTQVALYNFWGLDQTLPKGDTTVGDVQANHPVGDNTTYFNLTGDVIVEILEEMLSQHGPLGEGGSTGSWMQIAGLRFQATWDAIHLTKDNGNKEGLTHKIVRIVNGVEQEIDLPDVPVAGKWTLQNVHVDLEEGRWAPLDPKTTYSVVSNHHVRFGVKIGDRFIDDAVESIDAAGSSIAKIITDFFAQRSPVPPPKLDDRELLAVNAEYLGQNQAAFDISGCRDHSCSYGQLACEEFRRVGRELGHGTQIALYSGALFRAPLGKGEVFMKDILEVHPDGTLLSFFWLSGVTIRKLVQGMLQDHGAPEKGVKQSWMQMAGLRFQATWDSSSKDWTLGPVEADLEYGAWQDVDNDLDYSIAADASMLVEGLGNDVIVQNAVLHRGPLDGAVEDEIPERPFESGPAVVAVMAGLFRHQSFEHSVMDDRQCLSGNCTWLPGTSAAVEEEQEEDVSAAGWVPQAIGAAYQAAVGDGGKTSTDGSFNFAFPMSRLFWLIGVSIALMVSICCCMRLCK